jgi:nicotinamidase-related amidase
MEAPSFWNPGNVGDPRYVPDLHRARVEGRRAGLRPAAEQIARGGGRHLLLIVDPQNDFGDKGRLPVAGTYADVTRLCERIVRAVAGEHLTDIQVSIDMHPPCTIHSDAWWVDAAGAPPDVSVPLFLELADPDSEQPAFTATWVDGRGGKMLFPTMMPEHTVAYAEHLAATGQGNIWVFADHCRQGTDGISIIPALAEIIEWAAIARGIQPMYLYKGMIPQVDWFGPFRPCMDVPGEPQGGLQTRYLDVMADCATIEIAGEAKDFCVNAAVRQIVDYYSKRPDIVRRIRFLDDCTSAIVPGSETVRALDGLMRQQGIAVIGHDAPFA